MSFAKKYNKSVTKIDWNIDTTNMEYCKCSEVEEGKVYNLRGCYITPDHGYGKGAVMITDDFQLNCPERFLEVVDDIRNDPEAIEDIKAGKVGIKISSFMSKTYKRKGFDIEFIDL